MEEKDIVAQIQELISEKSLAYHKEYEVAAREGDDLVSSILLEQISLLDNLYEEIEIMKKSSQ